MGSLNTDLAVSDIYGNFYILLAGVGLLDPNHIPSTITTTSTIKTEGNTEKIKIQNKSAMEVGLMAMETLRSTHQALN